MQSNSQLIVTHQGVATLQMRTTGVSGSHISGEEPEQQTCYRNNHKAQMISWYKEMLSKVHVQGKFNKSHRSRPHKTI